MNEGNDTMSGSLNKVQLIGHLGKDPELKYTPSGVAVANFSIATNESWKDQEGNVQERTEWHNIVAWRASAEYAEKYIRKGAQLYIEGKIQTRSWEKDGIKRYTTEIYVESFQLLGKKPETIEALNTVSAPQADAIQAPPHAEDDLPF